MSRRDQNSNIKSCDKLGSTRKSERMRANSLLMKGVLVTSEDEECHPIDQSPFNIMQLKQVVPGFGLKKQQSQAVPHMSPMGSVYPSPSLNFAGPQISFPLNTFDLCDNHPATY